MQNTSGGEISKGDSSLCSFEKWTSFPRYDFI